jgi:serine/threonine protein kinase
LGEAHKTYVPDSIYELRKTSCEKANPGHTYDSPDYPQWLEDVIMKCLEKDPKDRFADRKALHDHVIAMMREERIKPEKDQEPQPSEEVEKPVEDNGRHAGKRCMNAAVCVAVIASVLALGGLVMTIKTNSDCESLRASLTEALRPVTPLEKDHPAIIYLDDANYLVRSEMEEIPELKGLWDALNTYDYAKFASYFGLLQFSDTYFNLLSMMKKLKPALDERIESGDTFVDEGKDEISTAKYVFKLII